MIHQYRRLPWFAHTLVLAHLLAALFATTYFGLIWHGRRQLVAYGRSLWPLAIDVREPDALRDALVFDHFEFNRDRWIVGWYSLEGSTTRFGWPLKQSTDKINIKFRSPKVSGDGNMHMKKTAPIHMQGWDARKRGEPFDAARPLPWRQGWRKAGEAETALNAARDKLIPITIARPLPESEATSKAE